MEFPAIVELAGKAATGFAAAGVSAGDEVDVDVPSREFTVADPDGNHWTFATFAG